MFSGKKDPAMDVLQNTTPKKKSRDENDGGMLKRQESDSLRLTDLLQIDQNAQNKNVRTSPLLQKRSISRASTALQHAEVPVIQPTKRAAKTQSKYAF